MHFKNKHGFLLIEAMLAIAIVSLMLMPTLGLQQALVSEVGRLTFAIQRWVAGEQLLYEARRAQPIYATSFTLKKEIPFPKTSLVYQLSPVAKESSLKAFKGLHQERVMITGRGEKDRANVISFVYKAPQEDV